MRSLPLRATRAVEESSEHDLDQRGNPTHMSDKYMTTTYPSFIVLMELAAQPSGKGVALTLTGGVATTMWKLMR